MHPQDELDLYLDEVDEVQEVEVLYLHKELLLNGAMFQVEVSFLSDHQKFVRVTKDGVSSPYQITLWEKFEDIQDAYKDLKSEGYAAIWNPAYTPELWQYRREAKF